MLRLPAGGRPARGRVQQVFVVHGDRAQRHARALGVTGADAVEVLDGLAEGDEVVISDMQDYEHVETIRLR